MKKGKIIIVLLIITSMAVSGCMKEQKGLQRIALDYYGDRYVEKESREDTEALFLIKADYLGSTSSELFNDENDLSYDELWEKIDYENTKLIPRLLKKSRI